MIALYLFILLVLGVYSYSQIDLNLTLINQPWFLAFQHQMIQLGYFNRPVSTGIFIGLTIILTIFYIYFFTRAEKLLQKSLMLLFGGVAVLGVLSYPAFSHDIFNYIFDSRIAIFHHANPYASTALMFPNDDWTRFMQWTHRTYPYGPVFLPMSFLFYILGLGKFILTLLSFKVFMVLGYLGSCYVIYKMAGKRGLILFGLNPLVIYEAVVAGHLDIIMLFFALYAIYKKNWLAYLISVGIKYATILNPPFIKNLKALILLAYIGAFAQVWSRELLPHYFLVPLGFSALLPNDKRVVWIGVALSVTLIFLRYYQFFITGAWLTIGL